jgi:hypothetical protein
MKRVIIFVLLLSGCLSAKAMMMRGPEITAVLVDPGNSNNVYLRLSDVVNSTGISTNGGRTFDLCSANAVPWTAVTNLHFPPRHYVLVDSTQVFRSDDGGATWTNTASGKFRWAQIRAEVEIERIAFNQAFDQRLPKRSRYWHWVFGAVALLHCLALIVVLARCSDWLLIFRQVVRSLVILGLAWCFLIVTAMFIQWNVNAQWTPGRFFSSYESFSPSVKTGVVMAIANRPGPLLCYLLGLWFVLPGSLEVLCALCRINKPAQWFGTGFARLGQKLEATRVSEECFLETENLVSRWVLRISTLAVFLFLYHHIFLIFGGYWVI